MKVNAMLRSCSSAKVDLETMHVFCSDASLDFKIKVSRFGLLFALIGLGLIMKMVKIPNP